MIVIISYPGDVTTTKVMRWLHKYNVPHTRLNFSDIPNKNIPTSLYISQSGMRMAVGENEISNKDILWARKLDGFRNVKNTDLLIQSMRGMASYIETEFRGFTNSILSVLEDAKWLLSPIKMLTLNKNEVLYKAQKYGLIIPNTLITNNKEELLSFLKLNPICITKAIIHGAFVSFNNTEKHFLGTTLLTKNDMNRIPDFFIPSTVQNFIDKEFELRVVYIDGVFFSAAIHSQKHAHTAVDSRMALEGKRISRVVPYILPEDVKMKLTQLMHSLGLNIGSIDMIYSKEKEYVFLEVNPAGQHDWISAYCNYNIDRYIANYFRRLHYEKKTTAFP